MIIIQIVNTFSLSVSGATFPNPENHKEKVRLIFLSPSLKLKAENGKEKDTDSIERTLTNAGHTSHGEIKCSNIHGTSWWTHDQINFVRNIVPGLQVKRVLTRREEKMRKRKD